MRPSPASRRAPYQARRPRHGYTGRISLYTGLTPARGRCVWGGGGSRLAVEQVDVRVLAYRVVDSKPKDDGGKGRKGGNYECLCHEAHGMHSGGAHIKRRGRGRFPAVRCTPAPGQRRLSGLPDSGRRICRSRSPFPFDLPHHFRPPGHARMQDATAVGAQPTGGSGAQGRPLRRAARAARRSGGLALRGRGGGLDRADVRAGSSHSGCRRAQPAGA